MTYEQAKAHFDQYNDNQRKAGIVLRSRGAFFPLNFNIELVDGYIAMVATVARQKATEATEATEATTKKASRK